MMKARIAVLTMLVAAMAFAAVAQAQPAGPPGGMIYANGEAYRTVGTPALLPNHGNFDTIYVLGEPLANVADAAPGDQDWNGGRWEVRLISWNITPTQFKSAEEVHMAAMNGDIMIGEVVKRFECPLIPMH